MTPDDRVALVKVEGAEERVTKELMREMRPHFDALNLLFGDRILLINAAWDAVSASLGLDREDWPTRGGLLDITADLERAANFAEHDGGEVGERLARMLDTADLIKKALG